jgi:glyoxylase-like metal-dependent hydrolase (beta-lactamase superfamily II)
VEELKYFSFRVGQFVCRCFNDGGGPRTAAAFLPSAPREELESVVRAQHYDPESLAFAIKPILISRGDDDQFILVDTGVAGMSSTLAADLAANGVALEAVGIVVITHGHGDHVNGILDANGELTYPNARYVLWRDEWDYWTAPDRFATTDVGQAALVWRALRAHADRVRLLDDDDAEIVPGVRAVPVPGHTVGQIAIEIDSDGEKFLHVADVAHHPFQLACPQWSPEFDTDKTQAAETRRAVFQQAASSGVLFSAYHFPFPGVGHIVERDGTLQWQPVEI